ncbi:hypothetical protein DFQ30_005895 [Apophysomyces sp. BC1015]|nr:hypothetical protein DFQ30_005895 [Apophysomyces sp. BC1015]KAG0181700.1 hypothetical protein DFQ29_007366 [Apophysomyces sp. BC1021]
MALRMLSLLGADVSFGEISPFLTSELHGLAPRENSELPTIHSQEMLPQTQIMIPCTQCPHSNTTPEEENKVAEEINSMISYKSADAVE